MLQGRQAAPSWLKQLLAGAHNTQEVAAGGDELCSGMRQQLVTRVLAGQHSVPHQCSLQA